MTTPPDTLRVTVGPAPPSVVRVTVSDVPTVVRVTDPTMPLLVRQIVAGPQGPPGERGANGTGPSAETKTVATPAGTWILSHGLGRVPNVAVYLPTGEQVLATVVATNTTVTVTFGSPTAGFAVLT